MPYLLPKYYLLPFVPMAPDSHASFFFSFGQHRGFRPRSISRWGPSPVIEMQVDPRLYVSWSEPNQERYGPVATRGLENGVNSEVRMRR